MWCAPTISQPYASKCGREASEMSKVAIVWLASLALVAALASAVTAQVLRLQPREQRVVSGSDVGFRVEGADSKGRPVGTLVIRVNGEWVEVAQSIRATP